VRVISRTRLRVEVVVLALIAVVASVVAIGIPVYALPQTDHPEHVDVVLVLGPINDTRMQAARDLVDAGRADALLVSVTDPASDDRLTRSACDPAQAAVVICFAPDPDTTQGEARALAAAAAEHGWTSAAVVTITPHLDRARLIVGRCFAGDLAMVDADVPLDARQWAWHWLYETGAFAKAAITPSC
jgi:hypothetical protein